MRPAPGSLSPAHGPIFFDGAFERMLHHQTPVEGEQRNQASGQIRFAYQKSEDGREVLLNARVVYTNQPFGGPPLRAQHPGPLRNRGSGLAGEGQRGLWWIPRLRVAQRQPPGQGGVPLREGRLRHRHEPGVRLRADGPFSAQLGYRDVGRDFGTVGMAFFVRDRRTLKGNLGFNRATWSLSATAIDERTNPTGQPGLDHTHSRSIVKESTTEAQSMGTR